MTGFTVRPAWPADVVGIKAMLDPILATGRYSAVEGPVDVEGFAAPIARAGKTGAAVLALSDDRIVGYQETLPDDARSGAGQIGTFVALDRHGAGLGRAMLAVSEARARSAGLDRLIATSRADNRDAHGFYQAVGFDDAGRLPTYIVRGGRPIDAVVKEKAL